MSWPNGAADVVSRFPNDAGNRRKSEPFLESSVVDVGGNLKVRVAQAAIVLGVLVRLFHVLHGNFPLNDGGLFYAMIRDLQHSSYRLPVYTSYNSAHIPFAYPPSALYFTGLTNAITGIGLLDLLHFLPFVISCLTIPAFYLLARKLVGDTLEASIGVMAFALIPRSFIWLLMGGGITRSFGLLFAMLALSAFLSLFERPTLLRILVAALFASLTVLSHLETGWFLAFTVVLLWFFRGRSAQSAMTSVVVAAVVMVATLPWWATVLSHNGITAFRAAQEAGGSMWSDPHTRVATLRALMSLVATSEPFFPLLGMLAILGAIVSACRGRWLLIAWALAIAVLDLRAYPTFVSIPIAMLVGIGVVQVLLPAINQARLNSTAPQGAPARNRYAATSVAGSLVLLAVLLYAGYGSMARSSDLGGEAQTLTALTPAEREAMAWAGKHTSAQSRYVVVPDTTWETASAAEWFPVLSGRVSVTTVQGREWLPGRAFAKSVDAFYEAYLCGYRTVACLDGWQEDFSLPFTHVYVPRAHGNQCCSTLVSSLMADSRYDLIYDTDGGTIFALRDTEPQPNEPAPTTVGSPNESQNAQDRHPLAP